MVRFERIQCNLLKITKLIAVLRIGIIACRIQEK